MRIDGQVHVVSPDRVAYPLSPPKAHLPLAGDKRWFDAPGLGAEDLLTRMDENGIDRAVLVQAYSAYQYDNRYTATAAAHKDRFAWACLVNVDDHPILSIRYWVMDMGARAVRFLLGTTGPGWLGSPACDEAFRELHRLGVVAQIYGAAEDLAGLLSAAKKYSEIPILLDHCAMPDLSGGDHYPRAGGLFALAGASNVSVKLSSHVFALARQGGSSPKRITNRLVEEFGGARVIWASDYTVHDWDYVDHIVEAEVACSDLTPSDRALVLGDAAAAMWWPSSI